MIDLLNFPIPQLNKETSRFVLIAKNKKIPFEDEWTTSANYRYDDPKLVEHIKKDNNIGYLVGSENYRIIDCDAIDHLKALGVMDGLNELASGTLCTDSGGNNGRFHFWIDCPEIKRGSKRYDPKNPVYNDAGEEVPVLEILGPGNQVVYPGSIHPRGTEYRVIRDLPIKKVRPEAVYDLIEPLSQHKHGSKRAKVEADKKKSKKRKGGKGKRNEEEDNVVRTASIQFSDGTMLEQIGEFGKYKFAVWSKGNWEIKDEVERDGLIYKPVVLSAEMARYVVFPSTPVEYESLDQIIRDIETLLKKYTTVSDVFLYIAARWIVMTYIYERLRSVFYLRVLGEPGSGKTRILTAMAKCCNKPISTMGSTSAAAAQRLINVIHGTLSVDEMDQYDSSEANQLMKMWNAGHSIDAAPMKCDINDPSKVDCIPCFCPKMAGTRKRFKDTAGETRCLTEICKETTDEKIPDNLPLEFYAEARQIRNKLLLWRFHNFGKVTGDEIIKQEKMNISRRTRQSYSCLAYVITNESESSETLKKALEQSDKDDIEQRANSFEGVVIRTWQELEQSGVEKIRPNAIATRMMDNSGYAKVTPEKVSSVLHTMGVTTSRDKTSSYITDKENMRNSLFKRYIPGFETGVGERNSDDAQRSKQNWKQAVVSM